MDLFYVDLSAGTHPSRASVVPDDLAAKLVARGGPIVPLPVGAEILAAAGGSVPFEEYLRTKFSRATSGPAGFSSTLNLVRIVVGYPDGGAAPDGDGLEALWYRRFQEAFGWFIYDVNVRPVSPEEFAADWDTPETKGPVTLQ